MSPERLNPTFENHFRELIVEKLAGEEIEKPTIGVIAISGTIGSGSTSVSNEIIKLINENSQIPSHFFSSGELMREIFTRTTGRRAMEGHFTRDVLTDRAVDKELGAHMIDLNSTNSLIVAEGRLAPYVASQLKLASVDLGVRLPSEMVTVFMTADENVRYYRKFLDAKKENPTLMEEEYYQGLEDRKNGEIKAFWAAYPDLNGVNPYNVNFKVGGNPVYELVYDTTSHEPKDIALKILNHDKVSVMLKKTGLITA